MSNELNLSFPDENSVIVTLNQRQSTRALPFTNPLTGKDHEDIRWYVETYGAHSLGDPDDTEAARIKGMLPAWGRALFKAVFADDAARERFSIFRQAERDSRLLTISTEHPAILSLPWELIHNPSENSGFLFLENPRISVRRRVSGIDDGREPFDVEPKDSLHLLFVVSRPDDAGFLDPRADSLPVLDAIDAHAPGRVACEFLRPPTLDALIARLEDTTKPAVDIVHFDGHGVFDRDGGMPKRAAKARATRIARLEEILREKKAGTPDDPECPPNTGYLLFENADGHCDFVSAEKLGSNLHRHKVGLVILSACQSATVEKDDADAETDAARKPAMGSVAARLTATGIPSVLAMTHSVLVATTRKLFGKFYEELAKHKGIGEALDNARRHLSNDPKKFEVQRGSDRVWLQLHDWFLPALYQPGADGPLLKKLKGGRQDDEDSQPRSNLPPKPEAGFFGRRRALWEIERWFAGPTRRITLTGFGGQGKTALAQEAGRWLLRTGLFRAAVFVDYSGIQTSDALGAAVANIGTVLGESLIDATAATAALKKTPTLIILDNLEALASDGLQALLSAAVAWSTAGASRVLCTTRRPEFGHPEYQVEGTHLHRRIALDGLGSKQSPDDALEWCAELMKLPPEPTVPAPKREVLITLFDQVRFHPLSIRVLAQQLKTRRPAEVGERLEQLLASGKSEIGDTKSEIEDTPAGLLASLELSLDKLDDATRKVLPRLGVFQGGAFEDDLIAITGLGDTGQREHLAGMLATVEAGKAAEIFEANGLAAPSEEQVQKLAADLRQKLAALPPPTANLWPALRRQLEAAALIEAEEIPGVTVPFLRFHPTLAPMLWAQLDAAERAQWGTAHRLRYYALSCYLYREDIRNPHQARAIGWRELPNLLHAVHAALDAGDPDAGDFANNVNRFLGPIFGLKQEATRLAAKAQAAAGEAGSQAWFLAQSNRGEQLFAAGQVAKAAEVFQDILAQLGEAPRYEQAVTLGRLGRCFRAAGRPDLAAQAADDAIAVCDQLEPSDGVKRHRGVLLTDKADALAEQGKYAEARKVYGEALKLVEDLNDLRSQGVVLGQLGTLAMLERREGWFAEALTSFRAALEMDQQINERAEQAVDWHQLGRVFQEAGQWDEAERHFRESARIREENGWLAGKNGAAASWNQLAIVNESAGKPDAAEMWYRKAIEGFRTDDQAFYRASALNNLADLLQTQPGRLAEARQLAEEALAIEQTLDPGAAEIWSTYELLAQIADREAEATTEDRLKAGLGAEAREYRRLARDAKRNFAGTRHELRRFAPIIHATVAACAGQPEAREAVTQNRQAMSQGGPGWQAVSRVLDRILAGERDETALCEGLPFNSAMLIETILQGLADPATLSDLVPMPT